MQAGFDRRVAVGERLTDQAANSRAAEQTGAGTALRLALPPGAAPAVTQNLGLAADAQRASGAILGGPQTPQTLLAPSVGGAVNVGQEDASGMGGDTPFDLKALVGTVYRRFWLILCPCRTASRCCGKRNGCQAIPAD